MDSQLNQDRFVDLYLQRDKIIIVGSLKNQEGNTIKFEKGPLLRKTQFGEFYQLTNVESKEVLVAKIITKSKINTSKIRQQVLQKVRIHQQIEHKNILKYEGVIEDQDFIYILLEDFKCTLNEYLQQKGQLCENEAKLLFVQIVDALNYLHENNILHRDLKLSNIYFNKEQQLKVGGFNYAIKLEQKEERRRSICGSSQYLAPDILDNENGYSFEVDLWYLGIILYTLIFGVHPFEAFDIKIAYQNIKANKQQYKEDVQISQSTKQLIDELLNSDCKKRATLKRVQEILI
ncbi:unnamed protein product (macronuclear) [Paramecium tetraurelia]|uniref:Protein kinase domain-containing protein n=1 Tax=Paramecium tetraurelia TaxID=5888 RepID=A0C8U0_PARTE|nr:uncharacterized protein GSPATT00036342001 [Paramecium tetraurelia]CAK67207.1 unnamed protein product [Paramecium tetraurelia]|eukprot:XP_001434604.1 hypothetical protein (macronuclear) [Paramecium tetraurelia strain d4-2]